MSMLDIDLIRSKFPALCRPESGIYLDNPGGTQIPEMVINAMADCLIQANSNLGGTFKTSIRAGKIVEQSHQAMADFVNANSEHEIIFGQNMTTLTFHISRSIGRLFSAGDEIILTTMEHDANISPWLLMARDHNLSVKFLPFDKSSFEFDLSELDKLLTEKTKLICFNHASNMTGTINDVKTVTEKAHAVGALVYVDSVQFAPHGAIDVQEIGCDFLVCSPYKFFGPHLGVLWGKESVLKTLEPYKVRPASDTLPDCFETGTLSHESMAGVTATVNYFSWLGRNVADGTYRARYSHLSDRRQLIHAAFDFLTDYEVPLTRQLIDGLKTIPSVTVHGITNSNALGRRVPTVSFTANGHKPRNIAQVLADHNIYVWDGHNYAIEPINHLNLMENGGVVRIGLAHYNTAEEVRLTLEILEDHLTT